MFAVYENIKKWIKVGSIALTLIWQLFATDRIEEDEEIKKTCVLYIPYEASAGLKSNSVFFVCIYITLRGLFVHFLV